MSSSVLLIEYYNPYWEEFGAQFCGSLAEAQNLIESRSFSVVAFTANQGNLPEVRKFSARLKELLPESATVLIVENLGGAETLLLTNQLNPHRLLKGFDNVQFQQAVHSALDKVGLQQQNMELLKTVHEQNLRLRNLSEDLERRIRRRQQYLLQVK